MALACKFWRLKMSQNSSLRGSFDGWSVVLVPASDAVMHRLQGYQRLLQAGGARVEVYDQRSSVNWVRDKKTLVVRGTTPNFAGRTTAKRRGLQAGVTHAFGCAGSQSHAAGATTGQTPASSRRPPQQWPDLAPLVQHRIRFLDPEYIFAYLTQNGEPVATPHLLLVPATAGAARSAEDDAAPEVGPSTRRRRLASVAASDRPLM